MTSELMTMMNFQRNCYIGEARYNPRVSRQTSFIEEMITQVKLKLASKLHVFIRAWLSVRKRKGYR